LGAKDIEGFLNIFSCFHIQYVTKFGKIIFWTITEFDYITKSLRETLAAVI
jgi:hypothetical protein